MLKVIKKTHTKIRETYRYQRILFFIERVIYILYIDWLFVSNISSVIMTRTSLQTI